MLRTSTGLVNGNHGDDDIDKGNSRVSMSMDDLFPESEQPAVGPYFLSYWHFKHLYILLPQNGSGYILPHRWNGTPLSP